MNFPKKIKIGCHKVDVIYPYEFKEIYDRYAHFNPAQMSIFLGDVDSSGIKRPDTAVLTVLIHELLHAIEYVTGHPVFKNMGELEENAIDGFANCIAQILIDNRFIRL